VGVGGRRVLGIVPFPADRQRDDPLPEVVDAVVRPVDVRLEILGRRRTLVGGFDQPLLLQDPQRVPDLVIRDRELVGELDDPDRLVPDHQPKHPQVSLQHLDLVFDSFDHVCPVSEEGIQTVERSADARAVFRKSVRCGRVPDGMDGEKERMLNGEAYDPDDPELVADRERARDLTRRYNRTGPDDSDRRRLLLEDLLGALGDDCHVEPPFRCDYGYNIHIGEKTYLNFDCVILDICRVEIGRNCDIGPGVHIYAATHPLDATDRAAGTEYGAPVTVGDNVWIGGRAVLNPGVTVGDNAVIASGAVVTTDVPANVVVGGNPATVIRELDTDE